MDLSNYKEEKPQRLKRIIWALLNATLFRWCLGRLGWPLRRMILIAFGAKIDKKAYIYGSCKIFAPWQLEVGRACVGPGTELYNKAPIVIGNDSVISQRSFICTASHDISSPMLPLVTAPISIGNNVWIASDVFVGMGVDVRDGAVVGARAAVFKHVDPWTVVGGNPAKFIKYRILQNA